MKIQSVVVAGDDIAGLLVALALKRHLSPLDVRVVRRRSDRAEEKSESTTAAFPRFLFEYLQLKPGQFYREVEPTWKLGTRFIWGPHSPFFYTFAREYEQPNGEFSRSVGFFQCCDDRIVGPASALMSYHKAFPRRSDGLPQLNHRQYGFHLQTAKLAQYLEDRCTENGVVITEGSIQGTEHHEDRIEALKLESGERVTADLFIDASGAKAELLRGALNEPFISYEHTLFCDRVVMGRHPRADETIEPYTTAETMDAGWCWQIEHEQWIDRGYVYSSRFISDQDAKAEFLRKNPQITDEPRTERFHSGRCARSWVGNVVAVGDAAGVVDPLESTALKSACTQANMLADSLVDSLLEPTPSLIEIYNEQHAREWDGIRDFLAVHYTFNTRLETPFWRACRKEVELGKAARIVRFFQENGPSLIASLSLLHPCDPFGMDGYLTMLIGMGILYSKSYRPSAAERHVWKKRITHFESQAQRAMTVKESLEALRRANWPGL